MNLDHNENIKIKKRLLFYAVLCAVGAFLSLQVVIIDMVLIKIPYGVVQFFTISIAVFFILGRYILYKAQAIECDKELKEVTGKHTVIAKILSYAIAGTGLMLFLVFLGRGVMAWLMK